MKNPLSYIGRTAFLFLLLIGCNNWIELDIVQNRTQSELVFSDASSANMAINGIYREARESLPSPLSNYGGLVSDELTTLTASTQLEAYLRNQIPVGDSFNPWSALYRIIYAANAALEGLERSGEAIQSTILRQYRAEARFQRAFCYFYLVNFYGDVPYITSTNVEINSSLNRTSASEVYNEIISDLNICVLDLQEDYSLTGLGKTRANKWAAVSLLARVHLYVKNYRAAEDNATLVINSGLYSLLSQPNGIFDSENPEAILQYANAPTETSPLAGILTQNPPNFLVTEKLRGAFETGDLRLTTWINNKVIGGLTYNYPFKFTDVSANPIERYTVLRLAEQYLIRGEARAMQENYIGAVEDINLIRLKHGGLSAPIPTPNSINSSVDIILHERYVELFHEGGHRWFDLKRTDRLDGVLSTEKPTTWNSYAMFYPIPLSDIQNNPNLKQNPGYE